MSLYYVGVMGAADAAIIGRLTATLRTLLEPLGISDQLELLSPADHFDPPGDFASVGVFFGAAGVVADQAHLARLMRAGTPLIPVVTDAKEFQKQIPTCLHPINGLVLESSDPGLVRLASVVLETLGLLPRQRRLFLSYRRTESREAALQLFEALSARHFDVFLDTHGVPPAEDFQEVLWHRLSDSDALVMLDTPSYFESRWTSMEFGKALAKSLVPVRLGWPGVAPAARSLSGESIQLEFADFEAGGLLLKQSAVDRAALAIERARSRGIALRSVEMVGALAYAAGKIDGRLLGLGPKRTALIELHSKHRVLVYPSVGIPTAEHLHQVATLEGAHDSRAVAYDNCGIARRWQAHLEWLGTEVKSARWLRIGDARWQLATWVEDLG